MSAVGGVLPQPSRTTALAGDDLYRFTVAQYHDMIRAGILTDDDPVELLEGCLVVKMPKNPSHSLATRRLRAALERLVPAGYFVDSQEPITTDDSEPEPDLAVVRGDLEQYAHRHPGPPDVPLVIEVSDSTLARDRGWKKRLYARTAIAVYWIVNLVDNRVEVYADPTGPAEEPDYRQRLEYGPADELPVVVAGAEVGRLAVRDLLP